MHDCQRLTAAVTDGCLAACSSVSESCSASHGQSAWRAPLSRVSVARSRQPRFAAVPYRRWRARTGSLPAQAPVVSGEGGLARW